MSSSRRQAHRPPANAATTASGVVRTLDVYPIQPVSSSAASHKAQTLSPPPPHPPSNISDAALLPSNRTTQAAAQAPSSRAAPPQPLPAAHRVSEDDYRLSPQEIQRRAQETLAAQVRTLLESRLQQRLQEARVAAAQERQAQASEAAQATATAAAAVAVEVPLSPAPPLPVTSAVSPTPEADEGEANLPPTGAFARTLPFTTTRLTTPAALAELSHAAAASVADLDPAKYAQTIDPHPYSAVELVRVHRLKGVPDHNRGLFAALARRSYTTRSGHLIVNPDLAGRGRVRSAVSGHVWEEQQQSYRQHTDPQGLQGGSQQQPQVYAGQPHATHNNNNNGSVFLDGVRVTSANNASHLSSSTGGGPSRIASSVRLAPPRLVMKVVGDGNQASFMWTEEDSTYEVADSASHSAATPLAAALADVLDHKYGKPLTEQEKAEAERRLKARRRREQQQQQWKEKDGKGKAGSRVGSGHGAESKAPSQTAPSTISANSAVDSSDGGAGGGRHAVLLHDLLPTVYDRDGGDNLTLSDGQLRSASTAAGGAHGGSSKSSSRLPPNSTSASASDAASGPLRPPQPASWVPPPPHTPASRAGLSVSALEHTMSVNEAQERQRDRQNRAEHSNAHGVAAAAGASVLATQSQVTGTADGGSSSGATGQVGARPGDFSGVGGGQAKKPASEGKGSGGGGAGPSTQQQPSRNTAPAMDLKSRLERLGVRTTPIRTEKEGADGAVGVEEEEDGGLESAEGGGGGLHGLSTFPRQSVTASGGKSPSTAAGTTTTTAKAPRDDAEQKQLDSFLEHFPEAHSHVRLRREAKNILDELEDMWDEDGPMSERPFPLPQFVSQEFHFPGSDDDNAEDGADGQRRHGDRGAGHGRPSRGGHNGAAAAAEEPPEEPLVGFDVDIAALQAKFTAEAAEECADLAARRAVLLAEVTAQRQLIRDFGDDVHFLSIGNAAAGLSAEQYAIELTREVNAYARKHHLRFQRLTTAEADAMGDDALAAALAAEQEAEVEAGMTLGFLERFGGDQIATRDVGCQVSDADLCYVDAAVRSTEAQLESLFHHEKALLNAVRLATVAVANILSFHASLEMECTCHECFFVFDKPRTLWPCGHTFCHACLSTMYNARGDLVCAECGSACEVGYTPNLPMELIANYQTVYTRADADGSKAAPNSALAEEREAQTIEGVLRNLMNDLLSTQHSWRPASPTR